MIEYTFWAEAFARTFFKKYEIDKHFNKEKMQRRGNLRRKKGNTNTENAECLKTEMLENKKVRLRSIL